jgi:hypothetical protein
MIMYTYMGSFESQINRSAFCVCIFSRDTMQLRGWGTAVHEHNEQGTEEHYEIHNTQTQA